MAENNRILVVEVNWLGDVLFSTPAIRQLKIKYPKSYICVLVHKRCKEILMGNPNIDEILELDEEHGHRGLLGKLRLINQLRMGRFDTAYLFHRSFSRTLVCFLSGIKNRIGYYTAKRRFLLTESIASPGENVHRAAYYYYIVTKKIPDDVSMLQCDFFVGDSDKKYINDILSKERLSDSQKLVVMHPCGNWDPKRWPKENFAQLADELIDKFKAVIVFSGAQKEKDTVQDILKLMKNKAINLCGMINLKQLGALFMKASLVISADSGPLHIAVALKMPTVAIFGPTAVPVTGPLTKENIAVLQKETDCAIPCYEKDCADNICMKAISVRDVLECIKERRWL
jgi:lipopolysaccharide heptosyltransferase II